MVPMFIVALGAMAALVMLLWNAIVPDVIGWTAVNYWQALGLLVLCRLLIGFSGKFAHGRGHGLHGHFHHHKKLHAMNDEERMEYIRKRFEQKENGQEERHL